MNMFEGTDGRGEILMKGVVEQAAKIRSRGTIKIGLQGKGTDSYLTQESLMLDATAKVDAVPALEIKTNDVKASHSATVAKVTAEDLFYFASRGIAEHDARKMFVLGFLSGGTKAGAARTRVAELVEAKYDRR
jgi:Fe-S cluster assembly scaffold protein SufB